MLNKSLLKKSALVLVMSAAAMSAEAAGEAKNIIFFLGDGMGPTTVTASRIYAYGEDGKLTMDTMKRTVRIRTYSEDGQTTDSAPSMAAYMTGVKMKNEVISMSAGTVAVNPGADANGNSGGVDNCPAFGSSVAAGTPVDTILEIAKGKGKAVGAITTTELTHATPAATFSHICNRNAPYHIARQTVPGGAGYNSKLGDGVDVLMGGGRNHWTPYNSSTNAKGRADGRDLLNEFSTLGYTVAANKTDMAAADNSKKFIGIYSSTSHLDYDLDRLKKGAASTQPSLSEMTAKAIDILAQRGGSKGYFLMVEGGRIDHALHGTDAKRALQDTKAFDDAIKTALGKVDLKNTLIVITADHDHVMTFNGYTARTGATTASNPGVLGLSHAYQVDTKSDAKARTLADGKSHAPNYDVNGKTSTTLVFGNGGGPRQDVRDDVTNTDSDTYLQEVGVKLGSAGSETHGGGDVMLFADGAGAESFKGSRVNTWVFGRLKDAFGF